MRLRRTASTLVAVLALTGGMAACNDEEGGARDQGVQDVDETGRESVQDTEDKPQETIRDPEEQEGGG